MVVATTRRTMRGRRTVFSWTAALLLAATSTITITAGVTHAKRATPTASRGTSRGLEDYVDEYKYDDLSQFSLHFDKCQDIRMYDDEIASENEGSEPFAIRSFVAFRICPTDTCGECEENFGRYVVDVETYLAYTVENRQEAFEEMCQNCGQNGCDEVCEGYNEMENNGYVDASQFVECQRLDVYNDDDDDNADNGGDQQEEEEDIEYYVGPRCSDSENGGSSVTIGLFADENCYVPVDDVSIEDVMGYKLSYILLSHSLSSYGTQCLSCSEDDYNNANDQQDADNVNEMCEDIYDAAAKCETPTGIQWGFMQENAEEGKYQNQAASEWYACNFIQSIYWDSYNNKGEINFKAKQDVYLREVTQTQGIAMATLLVVICGMAFVIRYFNGKITDATGVDGLAQGTIA